MCYTHITKTRMVSRDEKVFGFESMCTEYLIFSHENYCMLKKSD